MHHNQEIKFVKYLYDFVYAEAVEAYRKMLPEIFVWYRYELNGPCMKCIIACIEIIPLLLCVCVCVSHHHLNNRKAWHGISPIYTVQSSIKNMIVGILHKCTRFLSSAR